jgi:hypothetical protein
MSIETEADVQAVCNALKAWFISQGLKPHEGMTVLEYFIAMMMVDNAKGDDDTPIEHKLKCLIEGISGWIIRDLAR